jgi:hypothetical protein
LTAALKVAAIVVVNTPVVLRELCVFFAHANTHAPAAVVVSSAIPSGSSATDGSGFE